MSIVGKVIVYFNNHQEAQMKQHLALLGHEVRDRVTGFAGVVTSISFDLYGCIMAVVTPRSKKDGKASWYDVKRLEVKSTKPVMPVPGFAEPAYREGGPAEKPAFHEQPQQ